MRRFYHILHCGVAAGAFLLSLTSCEKDLQVYNDPTGRLNFYYPSLSTVADLRENMVRVDYSFVYAGETVTQDTVWFELETMGFVWNNPRPIEIEQVKDTVYDLPQAVEGKHFVSLTDEKLSAFYQMQSGATRAKVPVVVLRDASLETGNVVLRLRIKENGYFSCGYDKLQERVLIISALLTQPSAWYGTYCYYNFGAYGQVKHQFLIEQTGEKWDDEYINALMEGDEGYVNYLVMAMRERLAAVNAERRAQGLDVLREQDGTEVVIEYLD